MDKTIIYVSAPEDRPDFRLFTTFLWCDEQDVDSDGNSDNPASQDWTELYMTNRANHAESFDINPAQQEPLILEVQGTPESLASRAAYFLALETNGRISSSLQGPYREPAALLPMLGQDFDVEAAMERVATSRYALATTENPYPWLEEG